MGCSFADGSKRPLQLNPHNEGNEVGGGREKRYSALRLGGRVQGPMLIDHENRGEIGFTFTSATLSGQEPT